MQQADALRASSQTPLRTSHRRLPPKKRACRAAAEQAKPPAGLFPTAMGPCSRVSRAAAIRAPANSSPRELPCPPTTPPRASRPRLPPRERARLGKQQGASLPGPRSRRPKASHLPELPAGSRQSLTARPVQLEDVSQVLSRTLDVDAGGGHWSATQDASVATSTAAAARTGQAPTSRPYFRFRSVPHRPPQRKPLLRCSRSACTPRGKKMPGSLGK